MMSKPSEQGTNMPDGEPASVSSTPSTTSQLPSSVVPGDVPNHSSIAKAVLCGVCDTNAAKYKCPRCSMPYCSVPCNKTHRENHPPDPEPDSKPTTHAADLEPPPPTETQVPSDPRNPWGMLDDNEQLQYLFKKYPGLPQQLKEINAATLPPAPDAPLKIPGLTITRTSDWNRDVGVRRGLEALRRARKAPGQDGEALREYTELITHLVYGRQADEAVSNALLLNRTEEERRLIQQLLEAQR